MPRRWDRFEPPFCPNPSCDFHRRTRGWRLQRWGSFLRQRAPRRVPRYRCAHCHRTFSAQTFQTTYWLRRPDLLQPVFDGLNNCTCLRQLARIHAVSPATIQTHTERLGRHALLFLEAHRPEATPPDEPVAADGFESFAFSQYHPCHVNVAVGAVSHWCYGFAEAELRRKGRMTDAQKARRAQLEARDGRPDPKAVERAMAEVLRQVAPRGGELDLSTDAHPAYPRACRRVPGLRVRHRRISSRAARTPANPLFAVNRLDLLVRHGGANHKRETLAFSKRLGGLMERFAVYVVGHGFQKSRSEKRQDATPAQWLGIVDHKLTSAEILSQRLFPSRIPLPAWWQRIYDRRVPTRALAEARPPQRRYAT